MNRIEELAELFKQFPGIGPRQSKRFVYFLLRQDKSYSKRISRILDNLRDEINTCSKCMQFFTDQQNVGICQICRNSKRDASSLMIVERDVDLENLERSGVYNGLYFILGGNIPLTENKGGNIIRENALLKRINEAIEEGLKEVIIATNATTEGDHTREYLDILLSPIAKEKGFKITHLGRGLSTGTELEYSDRETLKAALAGRS